MPRSRQRRPTRHERQAETRKRVLEAATRVFARRGYAAASIEEIADEAGFSHGAVYSNFAGKEALFLAVYEERIARRQGEIGAAGEKDAPGQWMARVRDDPEYFLLFLEFVVQAGRNDHVRAAFARKAGRTHDTIAELLAGRPDLPLPPERLALAIRALGLGLAIEHVLDPGGVPPELYGEVVALMVRGAT